MKCVPFVSEYNTCNDDNACSGCSRCRCNGDGEWSCEDVHICPDEGNDLGMPQSDEMFDNALNMLEIEMSNKKPSRSVQVSSNPSVPSPQSLQNSDLLAEFQDKWLDDKMKEHSRPRRSTGKKIKKHTKRSVSKSNNLYETITNSSHNNDSKYHDAISEINAETLKDSNLTGTLIAKKIDIIPLTASRRSGLADNNSSKALQIEYNQPKIYNQITDNKLDEENKFDSSHEHLKTVLGNYTQNTKNKHLSKIVVNELKKGSEIVGDASAPVTSNITFTPENDTLTAMAFIAGNLLNKLWSIEKDATGSSMETDILQHEKISDLLDLFKEPLNIRQEMFLKNALEQLSTAIDKAKDAKNISICETIQGTDDLLYDKNEDAENLKTTTATPSRKSSISAEINEKKATLKAIAKITNVLDLIKKFESVQENLSDVKSGYKVTFAGNHTSAKDGKHYTDTELTKDEKNSLNVFGNVLEKITKLILPKRKYKNSAKMIANQNVLNDNDNLKKKFKKMYNIDLSNMTVNAKDKLILDYLTHVNRNPDCLLNNRKYKVEAMPSVEGNILLNLSEFFRLKSFSDLIKLLEAEKSKALRTATRTEKQNVEATTKVIEKKVTSSLKDTNKFNSTKEKLKAHLKTIIEDLIELQSARGVSLNSNLKIAEVLPCIYKVLNAGTEEITPRIEEDIDPVKKIVNVFNEIKKELKMSPSRRNIGDITQVRPKSAAIWERIIKNLNNKLLSRRMAKQKIPKSYDKIKEMMENIENASSTYKHRALIVKVPATEMLMLLKALDQDVRATIRMIEELQLSFESLTKLPKEKYAELEEFVENMATGIKLSEKVYAKVQPNLRNKVVNEVDKNNKILGSKFKKTTAIANSNHENKESDEVKVSRIQIVNQLIKNRIEKFLKMKEESGFDVKEDLRYNIARRILFYLNTGNFGLANELFKGFITQKNNKLRMPLDDNTEKDVATSTPKNIDYPMRRMSQPKNLLQRREEPTVIAKDKQMNWVNQDYLIKQLLNMKNMGL